jgi:hypothetical protein
VIGRFASKLWFEQHHIEKKFKTIEAEDMMSLPTSLTRGRSVFAESAELAVA